MQTLNGSITISGIPLDIVFNYNKPFAGDRNEPPCPESIEILSVTLPGTRSNLVLLLSEDTIEEIECQLLED